MVMLWPESRKNVKPREHTDHLMVNNRQNQKRLTKANQHQQHLQDKRLSRLEVSVIATTLLCLLIFFVLFLNKQLMQNQIDQMASRAQSVADWITTARDVRERNAGLFPQRCQRNKGPLSICFQNVVAPGQPFAALRNLYAAEQESAPAFAFVSAPRLNKALASCHDLPSPVFISTPLQGAEARPENWKGIIIVQPSTLMNDLSAVANRLSVGYCDRQQRLIWVVSHVSF